MTTQINYNVSRGRDLALKLIRLWLVCQSHLEEFEKFRGDEYGKFDSPDALSAVSPSKPNILVFVPTSLPTDAVTRSQSMKSIFLVHL